MTDNIRNASNRGLRYTSPRVKGTTFPTDEDVNIGIFLRETEGHIGSTGSRENSNFSFRGGVHFPNGKMTESNTLSADINYTHTPCS